MQIIELSDKIWSIDITFVLPGILLITVPLPFDEELQLAPSHVTIQYLFNFEMFFAIKQDWCGGKACQPGIGSSNAEVSLMTGKTCS